MKKFLIILLSAVIAIGAFSCSKDLTEETPLIDMGGSDEGSSAGNPYWDWADKFPGIVSASIERAFDHFSDPLKMPQGSDCHRNRQ